MDQEFYTQIKNKINTYMDFLNKLNSKLSDQADKLAKQTKQSIRLIATTSSDVQESRMAICRECEHLTKLKRCRQCGCFMDAKTWLADQECPIGKWNKVIEG